MRLFDRLQRAVAIVDKNGWPSLAFQSRDQRILEKIEALFASQQEQIDAIAAAQAAAAAAQAAADSAQNAADTAATAAANADTAASNAQGAADTVANATALQGSYVGGVTMIGADVGASATVSISGHTRYYADGTSVSVTGGSVTGLAYSTDYFIYYDQPSRAGGSVTYQATTSETTAAQVGDRHLVGMVTTPAALAPDTDGRYVRPPGVGDIP